MRFKLLASYRIRDRGGAGSPGESSFLPGGGGGTGSPGGSSFSLGSGAWSQGWV